MSGTHKVFIYGTLLGDDSRPNVWGRKVTVLKARLATVRGRLFMMEVPYLVLDQDHEGVVHGKVFEIDDDTLLEYDSIEGIYPGGSGGWYDRNRVMARYDDGSDEEVWIYSRPEYMGGEHLENGQFEDWRDDDLFPIPEDKQAGDKGTGDTGHRGRKEKKEG
jgi:gamma-glutamylcyclotransferase (GGCT)/AIG2-like uncharacterized protein YtfP